MLVGGAHLAEGHDHLGGPPGVLVLPRTAHLPGGGRDQDDLIRPGGGVLLTHG